VALNSPSFRVSIKVLIKHIAFNTPLYRSLFNVYQFGFGPTQLIFLTECITSVSAVSGSFVEAGCAYGATTVFLNKFMDEMNIIRDCYYALDTFSGFQKEHVDYEVSRGRKSLGRWRNLANVYHSYDLRSLFGDNDQSWFNKIMKLNGITRVKSLKTDVSNFDFSIIAPIAFCLLDVDLYIPIRDSLPRIYDAMSPGGVLIVDDCRPNDMWDGALRAYEEFIKAKGIPREIVYEKLGVIRKTTERSEHLAA
jgi:SAM-dependent methyltransferase